MADVKTENGRSVHAGHRARMRQRFLTQGLDGFSDHEALELLLMYAIPQKDVNPLAHMLIDRFGSFSGVLGADASELMAVPGMGEGAVSLMTLLPQLLRRYQLDAMGDRPMIGNSRSAGSYARSLYIGVTEERAYVIALDASGRVLCPVLLRKGTVDAVPLHPREVVEIAIRHRAKAVLMIHNHPGGEALPSQADYGVTKRVIDALAGIEVALVDHLIVSDHVVYSMVNRALLDDVHTVQKREESDGENGAC